MDTIKRKLTSRKLWVALAGVVVGLAAIMGAGEAEIATVAGAITATASAVAYIVTEGRLKPPPDNAASILAAIVAALNGPEADSYQAASIREILRGAGVEV